MSYIIETMSTKQVKTKFGMKPTFSMKADGEWYGCGFKKPPCSEGDTVDFTFTEGTYGKVIDEGSIKVISRGAIGGAVLGAVDVPKSAGSAGKPYGPPAKPFPIPALHGDRAIVRQNALTNAREAVVAAMSSGKGFALDIDVFATQVIALARKFEAYSCGDLDMAEAMSSSGEE